MKALCTILGLSVFLLIVNSKTPTIRHSVGIFYMSRCKNATGDDFETFGGLLLKCDKEFTEINEIVNQLNEDKNTTATLFRKFCKSYPELKSCTEDASNALKKCLHPKELTVMNVFSELQQFMCSDDGKQGLAFIAEDGVKCLNTTSNDIEECAMKSFASGLVGSEVPVFNDLDVIKNCVKTNLETCSSKNLVKIFEAFFTMVNDKWQSKI